MPPEEPIILPPPPTIEERLLDVETKLDFIYKHVAAQAAQQLLPQLQAEAEKQVMDALLKGQK